MANNYGARTLVTCDFDSLASGSYYQSSYVDNGSSLYPECELFVTVKTGAGAPSGDACVYVYVGGYDGASYEDRLSGSEGAITPDSPTQLRCLGAVNCPAASSTYYRMFSVAQAFGGHIPARWCVVVRNAVGQTLDTSGNSIYYRGIY